MYACAFWSISFQVFCFFVVVFNQYSFSQYSRTNMTYLVMPNYMSKGMENMCEELMNND